MHSLISLTISIKISYIFDKYFKFLDRKWPQVQKPMVRLFRDLLISAVRLKVESRPGPKWSKTEMVQDSPRVFDRNPHFRTSWRNNVLVRGSQLNFYFKPSCQYQTSHGHQNRRERVNKIWISFLVKIRLYRPSKILERLFECPYWELLIIFWFFLIPNRGVEYLKDLCQKFFMRFDIHLVNHLR